MMSNLSTLWRILLSLTVGFLLGISIKTIYNLTAKQPCYWQSKPIIINCAGSDINEETIQRAIKFWREKGEDVYFYEYNGIDAVCKDVKHLDGFIIINTQTDEVMEANVLASTSRKSRLNIIQSGVITFKPGRHNIILLLEHELGHAFGYTHRKIPGHIMHPYYDLMGDKFWFPG